MLHKKKQTIRVCGLDLGLLCGLRDDKEAQVLSPRQPVNENVLIYVEICVCVHVWRNTRKSNKHRKTAKTEIVLALAAVRRLLPSSTDVE